MIRTKGKNAFIFIFLSKRILLDESPCGHPQAFGHANRIVRNFLGVFLVQATGSLP